MALVDSGFVSASSLMPKTTIRESDFSFGEEVETADGFCLKKETVFPFPLQKPIPEEEVRMHLAADLTLVSGIGKIREAELKRNGISTIHDLKKTRFRDAAEEISDILMNGSKKEILYLFSDIRRSSDPVLLGLFQNQSHHLCFDIETLGMAHAPIILFGVGEVEGDTLKVTQYLVRDIEEELPALMLTRKHFTRESTVITYNGKCFDIPYLNNRLAFYGEREVRFETHLDLLHPTRRLFRHELPDCRLGTVEEYIPAFQRGIDIPGYLVPVYYQNYLQHKNLSILRPIVEHNTLDVANLASLLQHEIRILYGYHNDDGTQQNSNR